MIKATELRIGNLVMADLADGFQKVISPIDRVDSADKYDPIILTPKILDKNGFSKKSDITWYLAHNHRKIHLVQYHGTKEFTFPYNENGLITIKYVHQLQNLIFSLTGKEWEVKL